MNKLPLEKRVQILSMLVEDSSIRSISHLAGVSINTVSKYLIDAGRACTAFHDEQVRDVKVTRVQCDEIQSFGHAKGRDIAKAKAASECAGDVWPWTAQDCDSRSLPEMQS